MKNRKHKPMNYPWNAEQAAHMKMRQKQNLEISLRNPNEHWMADKLSQTNVKWSRQSQRGFRIFDFWCHTLGIAVEVDGPEHNKRYDAFRDSENLRVSGIVVLRVRNRNERDAKKALDFISRAETWNERRARMGLKLIK